MKYDKPDHSLIKYILALLNIPSNADASCQQAAEPWDTSGLITFRWHVR